MSVYLVLEHPERSLDRTVFVKEGFAPLAAVFHVLYALYHRMWVVAAVLVALLAAVRLGQMAWDLNEAVAGVASAAIAVIFGMEASNLRAASLRHAGYDERGPVVASSLEEAELKYASARESKLPAPLVPRAPAPASDALGLFGTT
jgi:hypothetical protein